MPYLRHLLTAALLASCLLSFAQADEPVLIATGTAPNYPQQPQIAVDPAGKLHLVYGVQNETYYTQSVKGTTFARPVKLPSVNVMSLGMRRGPRVAATGKSICVTVVGGKQGKGRDGDVLACYSTNEGESWSDPAPVNDAADSAREGLHSMACGPRGEIGCIWLDLRNMRTEVMAAFSTDGGKTWSKNALVYRSPEKSVCECCHPSMAFDSQGRAIAMWRNALEGKRDMYYAVAASAKDSFGAAKKLGTGSWTLDRCPMDGGALAIGGKDALYTVWRRDKKLFTTAPDQPELKVASGEQPVIAASSTGPAIAWLTKRGGDLMLQLPKQEPRKIASNAYDPSLVSLSPGTSEFALAWESREGTQGKIYSMRVK